jgi:hypothetical protein
MLNELSNLLRAPYQLQPQLLNQTEPMTAVEGHGHHAIPSSDHTIRSISQWFIADPKSPVFAFGSRGVSYTEPPGQPKHI